MLPEEREKLKEVDFRTFEKTDQVVPASRWRNQQGWLMSGSLMMVTPRWPWCHTLNIQNSAALSCIATPTEDQSNKLHYITETSNPCCTVLPTKRNALKSTSSPNHTSCSSHTTSHQQVQNWREWKSHCLQGGALLLPDLSCSTARAIVPQSAQGRKEQSCRTVSVRNTSRSISITHCTTVSCWKAWHFGHNTLTFSSKLQQDPQVCPPCKKQRKDKSLELAKNKLWALELKHCGVLWKLFIELKDRDNLHQIQCQTHLAKKLWRATSIAWNMILGCVNVAKSDAYWVSLQHRKWNKAGTPSRLSYGDWNEVHRATKQNFERRIHPELLTAKTSHVVPGV